MYINSYKKKKSRPKLFDILKTVEKTVGIRQKTYLDFAETMKQTAVLMEQTTGRKISAEDVAMVFVLNKLVRCRGQIKRDNIIDAIAYLCVYDQLMREYEGGGF